MEKYKRQYQLGHDQKYAELELALSKKASFITKIVSYRLTKYGLTVKFSNNISTTISPKMLGNNIDTILENMQKYLAVEVTYNPKMNPSIFVEQIVPIEPEDKDTSTIDAIVEDYSKNNRLWELLLQSFGYTQSKNDGLWIENLLHRIFPVFRVNDSTINIIELSNKGTGKSTTGLIFRDFFNFFYSTEIPTLPFLVYDAKTKQNGIISIADGLIFDEVQLWKNSDRVTTIMSVLNTGLEQCTWNRAVSGAGVEPINKCMPIVIFGNEDYVPLDVFSSRNIQDLDDYILNKSEIIDDILTDKYQHIFTTKAVIDRYSVIHIANNAPSFDATMDFRVLYPQFLRYLVSKIQERIDNSKVDECSNISEVEEYIRGRRKVQYYNICKLMSVLNVDYKGKKLYAYMRYIGVNA